MRKIIPFASVSFITLSLVFFTTLCFFSYREFLNFIENLFLNDINKKQNFETIFNVVVYLRLKISLLIISILGIGFYLLFTKNSQFRSVISTIIKLPLDYFKFLLIKFCALNKNFKFFLIILISSISIHRVYISLNTSVIYDEAWTYLAFTSKNPIVAVCFYPASNNHILFSHLTQLTKYLPFDILFNLRLPSIISGILAILTFFFLTKKYVSNFGIYIAIIFFSLSFPVIYYGFAARGYSLLLLMFVISFFSAIEIIQNSENRKAFCNLTLSSALGFYTIPIYLYPYISILLFISIYFIYSKKISAFFRVVKFGILTSIIVILLYMPIFVVSGVNSVISNKFVKPKTLNYVIENLTIHFSNTARFITAYQNGIWVILAILFLFACFIILFKTEKRIIILFTLFFFLIMPVFLIVHKLIPVERTWIFLIVPLAFGIGKLCTHIAFKIVFLILCFANILNLTIKFEKQIKWYDYVCDEDYFQGKFFTKYFINKKVEIVCRNRMNTYLKFNKTLYKQEWEIADSIRNNLNNNKYLIVYNTEKTPTSNVKSEKLYYFMKYSLYKIN